ncbi:MAG: AAA family ATPase [Bryobacteraceae bacterium]
MILRSIEVEGFRCFDRLVTVGDFAPGLNVLSGPNGSGKSTLLRALRHVLLDAHSLTGEKVKQAMSPWGRALNPRIRAVIEYDGTEWRLEKRFLAGSFARLERQEGGVFRPVSEGKVAEDKVRAMLIAEAAPKGMASENHFGLLQVLWTPQRSPQLPEWSAGVRTTLQEAFGAALSSRAADQLSNLIETRFEEYFAPKGGVKKSSPVSSLQQEATQLGEQLQSLQTQWRNAGQNRESLAALRARINEQASRYAAQVPELQSARERQREVSEATSAELQARQIFEGLESRVKQWRGDIAAQRQLDQQVRDAKPPHEEVLRDLAAAHDLQPKLQALEVDLESLRQSEADARAWPDLLRHRTLTAECSALRAQYDELQAPTSKVMAELHRLHQQLQIKQAGLEAASLKVTLEAEAELTLETDGLTHVLAAGQKREFTGAQGITVRLPGIARFTAASANDQAAGLAREVETLSGELTALLNGETLPSINERFTLAQSLQQKLETKEAEARPLDLRRAEFETLSIRRSEWASRPPDLDEIRSAWKASKDSFDQQKSQYNLPALSAAEAAARTTLEERNRQLAQIAARLAQHAATGPLDALEIQIREALLTLTTARTRLQGLKSIAQTDLNTLEQTVGSLNTAINTDNEAAARLEGELAALQSQNLYTSLAETEERLAECTANLNRQSRRAAAIQLLKSTLTESRKNLTAALPDQIAGHATRNWRHIAGPSAHAIRIDQSWTPSGLEVPDANAPIDDLSGGEAEQVAFATRLALATQLAQTNRQLAVFDDAFLATDPTRADRILELLAAAAERLQIIVLTCHPTRYQNLPAVRSFDLEKLKQ